MTSDTTHSQNFLWITFSSKWYASANFLARAAGHPEAGYKEMGEYLES